MNRELLLNNEHIVSNGINRCAVHGVCRDGFHSQALLSVSGCHVFRARTRVAFQRACLQKLQVVVRDRVKFMQVLVSASYQSTVCLILAERHIRFIRRCSAFESYICSVLTVLSGMRCIATVRCINRIVWYTVLSTTIFRSAYLVARIYPRRHRQNRHCTRNCQAVEVSMQACSSSGMVSSYTVMIVLLQLIPISFSSNFRPFFPLRLFQVQLRKTISETTSRLCPP